MAVDPGTDQGHTVEPETVEKAKVLKEEETCRLILRNARSEVNALVLVL